MDLTMAARVLSYKIHLVSTTHMEWARTILDATEYADRNRSIRRKEDRAIHRIFSPDEYRALNPVERLFLKHQSRLAMIVRANKYRQDKQIAEDNARAYEDLAKQASAEFDAMFLESETL